MTFFSGTDTSTLQSEGSDTAHFVSLIVNNSGPYCAKVTRRVTALSTLSYPTFDDKSEKIEESKTYIEAFKLNIVIEDEDNSALQKEVKDRYDKILKEKRASYPVVYPTYGGGYRPYGGYLPSFPAKEEKKEEEKKEVIKPNPEPSKSDDCGYVDTFGFPHLADSTIKALTGQILYGSITMTAENFDKFHNKNWVNGNIVKCFNRKFGINDEGLRMFEQWMSNYLDFLLNNINDDYLESAGYASFDIISICASNIKDTIKALVDGTPNEYIKVILNLLNEFILEEEEAAEPTTPVKAGMTAGMLNTLDEDSYDCY